MRAELLAAGYDIRGPAASHVGALVGTGVHTGAAYMLDHMRMDGSPGAEGEAIERGIVSFRERMQAEGATWDEITDQANTAEKQIRRMVLVYRREVAPMVRPIEVEERAEAEFAPGWILSGQVDALESLTADGEGQAIGDTKTGRVRRHHGPQLGAYSLLFEAHGFKPTRAHTDFIQRVPLAKEQPSAQRHPVDLKVARQDAWGVMQRIRADAEEFERRLADPAGDDPRGAWLPNPASSLCSPRWCPAHGTRWCSSHRP